MSLVVSLSAIPPRFDKLFPILEHLQRQTAPVEEIRLYIPKRFRRFPDYDGSLPDVPKGIRIMQPSDDLGPASKVLFAAEDLRGTDTDIIYCDDDHYYAPDHFERILAARGDDTSRAVAAKGGDLKTWGITLSAPRQPRPELWRKTMDYRMTRAKHFVHRLRTGEKLPKPTRWEFLRPCYLDIAMGYGGVLVRPDFFDDAVYDIPPVIWAVDDIWLSGHLERRGIPIWLAHETLFPKVERDADIHRLQDAVIEGAGRLDADLACIRYMQEKYGIWS